MKTGKVITNIGFMILLAGMGLLFASFIAGSAFFGVGFLVMIAGFFICVTGRMC